MCRWRLALAVSLAATPVSAVAASIVSLVVERDGRAFQLAFEYHIDAPADRVRSLVTDYSHLEELSPATRVSRVERDAETGRERLHLELRPCVWIFCRRLTKISLIEHADDGSIIYRAVPGAGDFESAVETLHIESAGEGARISYRARLVPNFFVPPLIGEWMMERTLGRDIAVTAERIERVLRGGDVRAPRDRVLPVPGSRRAP